MANPRIITNGLDKTSLSERVQKTKSNNFSFAHSFCFRGFEEFFFFHSISEGQIKSFEGWNFTLSPDF